MTMTMSVHLLVLACACAYLQSALCKDLPPDSLTPYTIALHDVEDALKTLEKNILSMNGNIPPLTDPRRQLALIYHVISIEAIAQSSCAKAPYSEDYQTNLKISVPEAVKNPQTVITGVITLIETFNEKTKEIQDLINGCVKSLGSCDLIPHLKEHKDLQTQAKLLKLASVVAEEMDASEEKFNEVAQKLTANEFVTQGQDELKKISLALADLYRELYHSNLQDC